ncbi:glutaminase A [bacterium (Candidatus Blackallbacteria) CG17_big_fil_post_rev_8_21_14_2_50_48_46]|uniref:Glutaminase n=1 Tax=bacterium (Candidatus Blackallbacteria) CG17_big_fil_post_rev_8_21_14_2_50_48_46 TaxID=2014261 RepID=A0A2M7GBG8_9BACT|nr:MAG: glutaminase A [bacterium (Candidatus Blackallbacteria) CG18_big_fil_WC_8_21_14_2_50_49_26]PIW19531.1 MAG: glutaminase A [bacterium (Candidatus Blackallbacteria) CG17_big_fil_post_rev_8_21_14_2_50_48_46]PIW48866.1 MAG: glutaminase A [bacterium (Candidatus Blackallbacteria) CG13_big_fil_rev_8_21_14_2_50_49_14]
MKNAELLKILEEIYQQTHSHSEGKVASYIPQLAKANPDHYAVAVCLADGTQAHWGQAEENFCLQSVCKPANYCLTLEEHGEEIVHRHVGFEPSGQVFNALQLNSQGLPHNPLINAGGIMCCSLIRPQLSLSDRFEAVSNFWRELSGGANPGFDNAVYQSERQSADRNRALAYFMRENKAFPAGADLEETLELYFQCCSLSLNVKNLAVAAASLALGGTCPLTGKTLLQTRTLRNCLTVMATCGMYNFSGEFAFRIGLPAKSGVSGALMVVIPGVMGLAIWSPPLDSTGNTVRGVAFCRELVERIPLHVYERHEALP